MPFPLLCLLDDTSGVSGNSTHHDLRQIHMSGNTTYYHGIFWDWVRNYQCCSSLEALLVAADCVVHSGHTLPEVEWVVGDYTCSTVAACLLFVPFLFLSLCGPCCLRSYFCISPRIVVGLGIVVVAFVASVVAWMYYTLWGAVVGIVEVVVVGKKSSGSSMVVVAWQHLRYVVGGVGVGIVVIGFHFPAACCSSGFCNCFVKVC